MCVHECIILTHIHIGMGLQECRLRAGSRESSPDVVPTGSPLGLVSEFLIARVGMIRSTCLGGSGEDGVDTCQAMHAMASAGVSGAASWARLLPMSCSWALHPKSQACGRRWTRVVPRKCCRGGTGGLRPRLGG